MTNRSPKKAAGWTNVQIYTAIGVVLIVGLVGGYLLHSSGPSESTSTSAPTITGAGAPPSTLEMARQALDMQTKSLLTRLETNPKDVPTLTELGNIYFDGSQWPKAIEYYTRSLNENPRHVQTLFNMGVVKKGGKNDVKGAIAAWESVLRIDPQYKDRVKLEGMLQEAKAEVK